MDASDLRMFETVAQLGGMNRAAEALNTVQSNVTQRIRRLEDEVGMPLFERHSRGVTLTAAGKRLLPYAREIRNTLEDAKRAVADDGKPSGPLLLGSLETTAALRLSPHISTYAARHPDVDFTLRTGTTRELIDMTLDRAVEGAFVCGPVAHPDLDERTVFNEELVILSHPDMRHLDDILAAPDVRMVVLRIGCSYRQRLEEVLTRRGVVGLRTLEFGTLEAIFGCVAAGLGITMLPKALVGPVWEHGRVAVHALPRAEAAVETVFIRHRDSRVSSALSTFLDLVAERQTAQAAE